MVEIVTLGSFQIKANGNPISESFRKTTKMLQLLNLLIINRNKPLHISTICDLIWASSDAADASKALHNLIYRLRSIFADNGVQDFIFYNNKTYMLNSAQDIVIDVYLFEDYYNQALQLQAKKEQDAELLRKAIGLYNGEYMVHLMSDDTYSFAAANRYRRIFAEIVCMLADIYLENREYDILIQLCDRAIALEPLEESVYLRTVRGLREKGMDTQAVSLIESYFDLLYREKGISASETLNGIYRELKNKDRLTRHNANQILAQLEEISSLNIALHCGFDMFKDIYRYEARQTKRRDYSVVLVLAELMGENNEPLPEKTLVGATKKLHESCMYVLRKGDMFAEHSKSMTIIMLTLRNSSDANSVLSRLYNKFYSLALSNKVSLKLDVRVPYDNVEFDFKQRSQRLVNKR